MGDPKNHKDTKITTTTDAAELGFDADVAAGAKVELEGKIEVGKSHTDEAALDNNIVGRDITTGDDPLADGVPGNV